MKIPSEDFADKALLVGDTYGDDIYRGAAGSSGHGGWQGGR